MLVKEIYLLSEKFPKSELHGLTSQTRRAAVSVPLNIVEGFSRNSKLQFKNFINIAFGSINELKVCLEIASDLKYIDQSKFNYILNQTEEVSKMLSSFKKSLSR